MRHIIQSEELLVPKPPESLTFSDGNSDSDEDHRQQDGDNVDCNLTFAASFASSEPHLLTRDLNDLVCDLNLSKKQAELVGSRVYGWNLLYHDTEICFFCNCH